MVSIILLVQHFGETGIRVALFALCANRILTYLLLRQVSVLRQAA
jgi:hypothetical protein